MGLAVEKVVEEHEYSIPFPTENILAQLVHEQNLVCISFSKFYSSFKLQLIILFKWCMSVRRVNKTKFMEHFCKYLRNFGVLFLLNYFNWLSITNTLK